jgi:hypothetical protein
MQQFASKGMNAEDVQASLDLNSVDRVRSLKH